MFGMTSMSLKKFLSQTTSLVAPEAAMYSVFIVESAMLDCLILLQTTAVPPRVNTEPDVDFLESLSLGNLNQCIHVFSGHHLNVQAYSP